MRNGIALAWIALAASPLAAQQAESTVSKTAQETAARISAAQENGRAETDRLAVERSSDNGQLNRAAARAVQLNSEPQPYGEKTMTQAADGRLDSALRNVSEQGRAILAQNSTAPALRAPMQETPALRAPSPEAPAKGGIAPRAPAVETGAAPKKTGKPGAKEEPPKDTKIVITAQGAAYFDSKASMAVFTEDVIVVHPQFTMNSDELEVYMKKQEPAPATAAGENKPAEPPPAKPAGDPSNTGDIDKAIGKGRKVVIQKADENGEPQIGICRHCTYDGPTGDVTLRDYPQVQRGTNVIIATAPQTYMILKANGELRTFGPNKVDIIQEAKKAPAPATTATAANPNAEAKPKGAKK
jgi:LptA/(LptD N-terminal domain) LPS transport protein